FCSVWVSFAQRRCLFAPLWGLVHARAKKIKAAWISLRRGGRSVSRLRGGNRLEAGIEAAGGYAFEGCQGKQVVVLEFIGQGTVLGAQDAGTEGVFRAGPLALLEVLTDVLGELFRSVGRLLHLCRLLAGFQYSEITLLGLQTDEISRLIDDGQRAGMKGAGLLQASLAAARQHRRHFQR